MTLTSKNEQSFKFSELMKLIGHDNYLNCCVRLKTIIHIKYCWDEIIHQLILLHNLNVGRQQDIHKCSIKAISIIKIILHSDILPSIFKF